MPSTSTTKTFRISAFTTLPSSVTARCSGLCATRSCAHAIQDPLGTWMAKLAPSTHILPLCGSLQHFCQLSRFGSEHLRCVLPCLPEGARRSREYSTPLESSASSSRMKLTEATTVCNYRRFENSLQLLNHKHKIFTPSMRKREISMSRRAPLRVL